MKNFTAQLTYSILAFVFSGTSNVDPCNAMQNELVENILGFSGFFSEIIFDKTKTKIKSTKQ